MFAATVALTALALAGAHAPAPVRLIGLFCMGFGLLAGWILAWLSGQILETPHRWVVWPALVLIVVAEVGLTLESHRLWVAAFERRQQDANASVMLRQLESQPDVPAGFKDEFAQARAERTGFTSYLKARASALGEWDSPWPAVLWLGEMLVGSLAGAWLFRRLVMRST